GRAGSRWSSKGSNNVRPSSKKAGKHCFSAGRISRNGLARPLYQSAQRMWVSNFRSRSRLKRGQSKMGARDASVRAVWHGRVLNQSKIVGSRVQKGDRDVKRGWS